MEQAEKTLDQIIQGLQKLEGLPAIGLVLLTCIVVGYVLRFVKAFPNNGIPVAVILWGGLLYPLLADDTVKLPLRIWLVRNVALGLITGFVAWIVHRFVLKPFEPKLFSSDTTLMTKDQAEKPG